MLTQGTKKSIDKFLDYDYKKINDLIRLFNMHHLRLTGAEQMEYTPNRLVVLIFKFYNGSDKIYVENWQQDIILLILRSNIFCTCRTSGNKIIRKKNVKMDYGKCITCFAFDMPIDKSSFIIVSHMICPLKNNPLPFCCIQ